MGTSFQSKPSSLSDRLPREGDRTPEFAVPFEQTVQTVEPVRNKTKYVTQEQSPMSGWIIAFLILIVSVGIGFMSLLDLSSQQNRTEREVFKLRQELTEIKLAEPVAIVPPTPVPVHESSKILTKQDFINKTFPYLRTPESTAAPAELPPPPAAEIPTEPVFGPQPAPVIEKTTPPLVQSQAVPQPVPGVVQ